MSPESQGELGNGSLEMRAQVSKRDQLNFENDSTNNSLDRAGSPHALGAMGELGLHKRLDIYVIPSLLVSPTIYGLKFQFLGSPRTEAKRGNFSSSLMIGVGNRSEKNLSSNDLDDFLQGNIDELKVDTHHKDIGLIAGYRWSEKILHYANAIYLREEVEGKVTSDSGALTNSQFKFYQDGMIYSSGFIFYFAHSQLKLDYSHFVSDWSHTDKHTINSLNLALGFNW